MSRLRCAVFGAGAMGTRNAFHAELTGLADVVAVCTRTPAGADQIAQRLGRSIPVYHDFSGMLHGARPDALIVAIPPFAHDGQVEEAASKGIHLFLEKPIALNLERARAQVDAAVESGVVTQVDFHLRFAPIVQTLAAMIGNGVSGRPTLFSAGYFCNSLHTPWWRDRTRSGGQIVEQVIHLYDLARYLLGPFPQVHAAQENLCHRDVADYSVEDTSAATLVSRSGAMASITGSNCAVPGKWEGLFTVVCEKLVARFSTITGGTITTTPASGADPTTVPVKSFPAADPGEPREDPHYTAMEEFLQAIHHGARSTTAPIAEGYHSLELVLRTIRSRIVTPSRHRR